VDRLRHLTELPMRRVIASLACALALACLVAACEPTTSDAPASSRFASVKKEANVRAVGAFCEKQWPAAVGARKYTEIPERLIPGVPAAAAAPGGAWKWINLWATWCVPCVEEMGLLARWKRALEKDGIAVELELWSVDQEEAKLLEYLDTVAMPGRVRWLRAPEDLPAVLESLGADQTSGIPVHALVDGSGNLRCVRVGSVHDEDYGAVKAMLSGT
jgi:thiol-disulfide isomerase/thioredoxin